MAIAECCTATILREGELAIEISFLNRLYLLVLLIKRCEKEKSR